MRRIVYCLILFVILTTAGAAHSQEAGKPPAQASPESAGQIGLIDLKDVDIKDALKFIAQKTGLRIIAGDNVQGRVTIYAEKVAPEEALALMLRAAKLGYAKEGSLIQVMSEADYEAKYGRPFSQRTVSKLLHLQGLKAGKAETLLGKMKSSFGKIIADEGSATVLLDDTAERVEAMEDYLKAVDRPVWPRVFIVQHLEIAQILPQVKEMLTPELGIVRMDTASGKLFVTDTLEKLEEVERFLSEIDVAREPAVLDLSYAKADELLEVVKDLLTPGAGRVQVGKRANQLIVVDVPARVEEVRRMIALLDRKDREVLIEARVIQIVLREEHRTGVDWEALIKGAHGLKFSSQWGSVGSVQRGAVAIGMLNDDGYRALLEVLATSLKSHVLSNPRVAVVNNQEAKILVGSTRPYVTTTTTTTASGPVTVAEDVKFVDVGVKLVVSPIIHRDGFITMKIRPEVSSAVNSIRTGQNNVVPVVDTSELETTVRVKDGVTIMLGGLIKDEQLQTGAKVPILGDVPVVGGAFRSRSSGKEKTELVIFLTPHIINGDVVEERGGYEPAVTVR